MMLRAMVHTVARIIHAPVKTPTASPTDYLECGAVRTHAAAILVLDVQYHILVSKTLVTPSAMFIMCVADCCTDSHYF